MICGCDSSNYRPISILSAFSKILEKLVCSRLMLFINKHNILLDVEHSFRDPESTETASQFFIENIQESMDQRAISEFYVLMFRNTLCSIFIGGVRKNNRDKIARVFIQVKVWCLCLLEF
jgi:hypothetical protein